MMNNIFLVIMLLLSVVAMFAISYYVVDCIHWYEQGYNTKTMLIKKMSVCAFLIIGILVFIVSIL